MAQVDLKVRSVNVNVTDIGSNGKVKSSKSVSFTGIFAKARNNVSSDTSADTTKLGAQTSKNSKTTVSAKFTKAAGQTSKSQTQTKTDKSQGSSSDSFSNVADISDKTSQTGTVDSLNKSTTNGSQNDSQKVNDVDDNFSKVDEKDDGNDETGKRASEIFNELFTMLNSIADTLGINLQDVTDYLKDANLSSGDLLDTNSFKLLIVQTDGLDDVSGLLTSEKGFSDLNSISNLVDNFLNSDAMKQLETGMTEGSINVDSLLQNFSDIFDKVDEFLQKLMDMLDNGLSGNEALDLFTSGKAGEAMGNLAAFGTTENVNSDAETENADTAKEAISDVNSDAASENTNAETVTDESTVTVPNEAQGAEENQTGNQSDDSNQNAGTDILSKTQTDTRAAKADNRNATLTQAQAFANIAQSVEELSQSEELPSGVTVKDIMDQIESQIKTIKYPEHTSLEMVLHPENLGRVFINVTSHAGELKATLMVQNEAARNALQNQVADLKLQFENQGLKVDNVEIMLANDGSYNNNNQSGQGADTRSENHRRRIFDPDAGESFTDTVSAEEASDSYTGEDVGNSVNLSA